MYSEIDILHFFFLAPYYIELLIELCVSLSTAVVFSWDLLGGRSAGSLFLAGSAVQSSVEIMCMWGSSALQASQGQKEALNRRENASKCCL